MVSQKEFVRYFCNGDSESNYFIIHHNKMIIL